MYVCVDDFSRFTWVNFLITKCEAFEESWQIMYKEHNNKPLKISRIRNEHDKEFEKSLFENLCGNNGLEQEFSGPKTL